MKQITMMEALNGHRGFKTAAEIVELMTGRPKTLPPLFIVVEQNGDHFSYQVEAAIYNGLHVEMIDSDGEIITASDNDRYRVWKG